MTHICKVDTTLLALKQRRKCSLALRFITLSSKPRLRSDGQSADWLIPHKPQFAGDPLHWPSRCAHRWDANREDLLVKVCRWQRGCSLIWRGREEVAAADRRLERWTQVSRFDCVNWNLSAAMSQRIIWKQKKKSPEFTGRILFFILPCESREKRTFYGRNQLWTSFCIGLFRVTLKQERTLR